ncbi:hypothetical protein Rhopal_001435-T1 [Rhodotorula paludigena]|uniref:Proteophosphoglycan ppg4 n=1 Tax=Rhodotorula paludigena TaxID=86838 RepID=A0AAV5GF06_9BASI|nr:hypothetical protein Rhopal_001435-T1 [Rhodotorula paludigena]
MASSPRPRERTLAVLFAPDNVLGASHARHIVVEAGFALVAEAELAGEELEEAGLDLGLGVGEAAQVDEAGEKRHTVWALEREDAVTKLKELKAGLLATDCPNLRVFAAPSVAAAKMALDSLFSSLPSSPAPASPASRSFPSSENAKKPFALSNLAFQPSEQLATPTKPTARQYSPSVEKALFELEQREEAERLRKLSRSSRGSAGSTQKTEARDGEQSIAAQGAHEKRVFTAHSPEPSDDEVEVPAQSAGDERGAKEESLSATAGEAFPELDEDDETHLDSPLAASSTRAAPSVVCASSVLSASSTPSFTSSTSFRARPAPSSTPSVQPRLTKAAALRLGISLPPSTPRRSTVSSAPASELDGGESTASRSQSRASGPRASVVPTPRSLAAPTIAPRMTKAASLRTSLDPSAAEAIKKPLRAPPSVKRQSISTAERAAMDRAARRQSAAAASTPAKAAPQVEVRMSRAAMLRQGIQPPPPTTSTKPRQSVSTTALPSNRRESVSADLKALREPALTPRMSKAATLRLGGTVAIPSLARTSSSATSGSAARPATALVTSIGAASSAMSQNAPRPASVASSHRSSVSTSAQPHKPVSSLKPAAVTPRLNKAAELRQQAKLAATAGAW